jgi:hypothetical protein
MVIKDFSEDLFLAIDYRQSLKFLHNRSARSSRESVQEQKKAKNVRGGEGRGV